MPIHKKRGTLLLPVPRSEALGLARHVETSNETPRRYVRSHPINAKVKPSIERICLKHTHEHHRCMAS